MSDDRLKVVLCWHMHQPQYYDFGSGHYTLPWTYLHALKDYTDMAAHLEENGKARAVVNFAPILLEQLADYGRQIRRFLDEGDAINDPLLCALASPVLPHEPEARTGLVKACMRFNHDRYLERFPSMQRLMSMANWLTEHPETGLYINNQFLVDLLVTYHLIWLGESVVRTDETVKALIDKQHGYTLHDRRLLLEVFDRLIEGLFPRYRKLAESGQIELSMSPYAHPIVPLLIDLDSAREAIPDVSLPHVKNYPDGVKRSHWHIDKGREVFEQCFGLQPSGCWPSEGAVSEPALQVFDDRGFRWVASGGSVLQNSLLSSKNEKQWPHQPFHIDDQELAVFFRDDGLSDLIGFTYSDWHADDAVANLVDHLETIHSKRPKGKQSIVSIILDGENAWEHYPENGYHFLQALYQQLSTHTDFDLTTFSDCLDSGIKTEKLERLVAGSWVYGTFSTWIGEPDKNHAWEMLIDAKQIYDEVMAAGKLDERHRLIAEQQLAICEGSDWFWWFGDYNPSDTVSDFDRLYRLQLTALYQLLGIEPPEYLSHVFAHGSGAPQLGGVMRRGN
jgi:alpha-amylase/alpha-mannosidase (GH57 family)